ncbi:hypothetical protein M5689_007187 [Euphorbia peplus]|nr:hypothetical protein M5689_007187 [Euphorbia peplus]
MGNYVSCKISSPSLIKNSRSAKVILPTGKIQQFRQPTKVAELMLETPNFFTVNSNSLKIGRRFCPLSADEDLQKGNVYVMFPMQRKNSVVTANDLGVLFMTANSAVKRASSAGKVRVQPDDYDGDDVALPRVSFEGIEEVSTPEFIHRLSISRSKKPLLETIDEEHEPVIRFR